MPSLLLTYFWIATDNQAYDNVISTTANLRNEMMDEYRELLAGKKSEILEESLIQFQSVHHKPYKDCPGNEFTPQKQEVRIKLLELQHGNSLNENTECVKI